MRIRRNKTILEQAADYVEAAVEKAGPILADAKDKAGSALADAREQAGPALADARDKAVTKAGPTLADARDKATPLIAQSAALVAEKASQAADLAAEKAAEGKDLAAAKAAELTGKPQKKHRLRKLLLIGGVAALLGFVAKKLRSGDQDNWQSSYTPPPPPRDADRTDTPIADAAVAAATGGADESADEGGAGPDEALADAAEESHDVTTPDAPAEVVDLAPSEETAANKSGKA
jgi:hypothetical protein